MIGKAATNSFEQTLVKKLFESLCNLFVTLNDLDTRLRYLDTQRYTQLHKPKGQKKIFVSGLLQNIFIGIGAGEAQDRAGSVVWCLMSRIAVLTPL